ncbi:MAG: S41 family peptidase [Planctomycetota bacterium]|nr:S41 family peptidase [Planctomycetota bacterium]
MRTVLAHLMLAAVAVAQAPKAVEIQPKPGATDVTPGDFDIKVTFDRPMGTGYSFTIGTATFPKVRGKVKWIDGKTCVLPVRLRPNHTYAFGINGPGNMGFVSKNGVPVEPVLVRFKTTGVAAPNPATPAANREAVERARRLLAKHYSYRELHEIDAASFPFREDVLASTGSPLEFARRIGEDLGGIPDPHIWLDVDGQIVPAYKRSVIPNVRAQNLRRYVKDGQQHGPRLAEADLGGGIRYVLLATWGDKEVVEKALEVLNGEAKAWVIDMRLNGGGNETLARRVAAKFIDARVRYAGHRSNGQVHERHLDPAPAAQRIKAPVAVLMGGFCLSSTEAFLLMMKQAKRATLIGVPSGGSSGNPQPHDLGNGVTLYLPSWQALRPDGTCFEREGVKPHIRVNALNADLDAGRDPVLERAIALLKKKLAVPAGK